ncbi:MAG: CBS domain-containing protein [Phycisphaerales bacterium]|nr:MAG: CBS domain-containing protein [Phycisphaerales bacterium]
MDALASSASTTPGVLLGPGLLFGLMLLAAIVGGHIAHLIHCPRVIGFVVCGAILRGVMYAAYGHEAGTGEHKALEAAVEPLGAIQDLALGLILFLIGGVFERAKLKAAGIRTLKISGAETALSVLFVFVGCLTAALLTQSQYGPLQILILALLLGTAAIATAPAATLFVLQEYESKGSETNTILGLTGTNNIVCIVLFYSIFLILASLGAITTPSILAERLWLALACTTLGSVGLGIVCGTLLTIVHAKLPLTETLLVFFALFILLGAGEKWLLGHYGTSFNFLLTCVVIGGIFANIAIDSQKLLDALRTIGFPIFAGFFVLAGYGLHIGDLLHMGWIGGAYVVCRFLGKTVGCELGGRWVGHPQQPGSRLGSALLCQAAVVIGLASFVERNWQSQLAKTFSTVVLGSVVVFELLGPLLVKRCVVQAGEVKAMTLLRRAGPATEGTSIVRVTLLSLLRLFSGGRRATPDKPETLCAKHIMRSSVQLIPAAATLDEVLHFIERSTHSHFPVVDEHGTLSGMIHFSDVRDVIYDPAMRELVTAVDLADPYSAVVSMDLPLPELLDVFTKQNVAVLPVVEQTGSKRIIGLVEQRDLLRALHLPKQ